MWHANLFFGIAKFSKLGMQNPFSGLQFAFFACNITFQTCGNDPPKKIMKELFLIKPRWRILKKCIKSTIKHFFQSLNDFVFKKTRFYKQICHGPKNPKWCAKIKMMPKE
jgi:hypothetical protein